MKKDEKKKKSKTQKTRAAAAALNIASEEVKKKEHHDSDNMKRGREEENNINGTTARKNTLAATKNNNEEERRRFEFERQMKELNEKFLEAFARSVREHPRAIKNNLMRQYLQFVKKLAMEYADVIASSKEEAQQKGGLLWIFGSNGDSGQFGFGSNASTGELIDELLRPRLLQKGSILGNANTKVIKIACGGQQTFAILETGRVLSWGANDSGALGRPTSAPENEDEDDESWLPGYVNLDHSVKAVSVCAGDTHALVIASDGTVYGWGQWRHQNGQWRGLNMLKVSDTQTFYNPVEILNKKQKAKCIQSGENHACILTENGEVYTMGCSEKGRLGRIEKTGAGAAYADDNQKADRENNESYVKNLLTPGRVLVNNRKDLKVKAIATGELHGHLIMENGEVYSIGLSSFGQGGFFDNGVIESEQVAWLPRQIPSLSDKNIIAGSGGGFHSLFLTKTGKIYAIGKRHDGRLGALGREQCNDDPHPNPLEISSSFFGKDSVKMVYAGSNSSGAITKSGELYTWGSNLGALGQGPDNEDVYQPTKVPRVRSAPSQITFTDMSIGASHAGVIGVNKMEESTPPARDKKKRRY